MRDDEKKKLHQNLKQEIRSLLISSPKTKYGGLSGSLLYSDYKQLNCGKEVPYAELGFHSFLSLLRSMPDVVRIEHKENSPSYRVHPVYDETTAHIQKMVLEQRDKYEHENQLYNQNWHYDQSIQSNQLIPFNFYNNTQLPFLYNSSSYYTFNSVQTNFLTPFHRNNHRLLRQPSTSQKLFPLNRRKIDPVYEPYLLLTPSTPSNYEKQNKKMNFQSSDRLPHISLPSNDNHGSCSTPNTFIETPCNFDFDDYRLNESIKDITEDNNNIVSIDNQMKDTHDDPLLTTSINNIPDKQQNLEIDLPLTSPSNNSIISSTSDKSILPLAADDVSDHPSNNSECALETCISIVEEKIPPSNNEIFFEILHCAEEKQSKNTQSTKRINDAIRQCIHFRYIHRLYELKFEYRHRPLSIEITSIKSKLENIAFNEYKQELEEFEQICQLNSSIDDQICQTMFDEYICLQRNYYYMTKLMKKSDDKLRKFFFFSRKKQVFVL